MTLRVLRLNRKGITLKETFLDVSRGHSMSHSLATEPATSRGHFCRAPATSKRRSLKPCPVHPSLWHQYFSFEGFTGWFPFPTKPAQWIHWDGFRGGPPLARGVSGGRSSAQGFRPDWPRFFFFFFFFSDAVWDRRPFGSQGPIGLSSVLMSRPFWVR